MRPISDRRPALAYACEAVSLLDAAGIEAKTELTGECECLLVLLTLDAAGELLVLAVLADLPRDVVLPHQVHVGASAKLLGDKVQDRFGLLEQPRHDQVPDDQAAARDPTVIQHEVADLAVHLENRLARDIRVVGALQIA